MDNSNSFLVLFLAPVREYLEDDSVSEILINGPQQVYIERRGRLEEVAAKVNRLWEVLGADGIVGTEKAGSPG